MKYACLLLASILSVTALANGQIQITVQGSATVVGAPRAYTHGPEANITGEAISVVDKSLVQRDINHRK
jgi:hypothetical protein